MNPGSVEKILVESAVLWMERSQKEPVVDERDRMGNKKGIEVERMLRSEKDESFWIPDDSPKQLVSKPR